MADTGHTGEDQQRILSAVDKIVRSGALGQSSRQAAILNYIVVRELEGRGAELKAYAIGIDVLERTTDFDPNTDSIVRVELRRLRQSLQHYYETQGKDDPIKITLKTGSYRPHFDTAGCASGDVNPATPVAQTPRRKLQYMSGLAVAVLVLIAAILLELRQDWPTFNGKAMPPVRVYLVNGAVSQSDRHLADFGLALQSNLAAALSEIRPFDILTDSPKPTEKHPALLYTVTLNLQQSADRYRLSTNLADGDGKQVWGAVHSIPDSNRLGAEDEFVRYLLQELRPQLFTAVKRQLVERNGLSRNAWELYLRATWIPGKAKNSLSWEKERIQLARRALAINSDFGQAHSVLADKLAYLANVDPASNRDAMQAESEFHAQRAMVIPPILEGVWRRTHAAICRFSFWTGVMPPKPMLGRSLL